MAPSRVLDFCEAVDVPVLLPDFMSDILRIHGRQFLSSGFASVAAQTSTPTTITETITSTLPWGEPAFTSTEEGFGEIVTVVVFVADTSISTTVVQTTTLQAGQAAYTSFITAPNSAEVTEIIGVAVQASAATHVDKTSSSSRATATGENPPTTTTATGGNTPINSPNPTPSTGLSSGAKIGIGASIAGVILVLIILGMIWFFRRRRRDKPTYPEPEQEKNDGGLPEPISTINEIAIPRYLPPSYQPQADEYGRVPVEAGGIPIHEMNQGTGYVRQEGGYPLPELYSSPSSAKKRHELHAVAGVRNELPATPSAPIGRKPVSPPVTQPSTFPAPWHNNEADSYTPVQSSNSQLGNVGTGGELGHQEIDDDDEIRQMEEEMERVRHQRERLQSMQALEAREYELRRTIEERRKAGSSRPS